MSDRQDSATYLDDDGVSRSNNFGYNRRHSLFYHLRQNLKILLFGQLLSLLLAGAGAAQATLHLDCGLSAPTFTMMIVYFSLSFHLLFIFLRQGRGEGWRQRRTSWVALREGGGFQEPPNFQGLRPRGRRNRRLPMSDLHVNGTDDFATEDLTLDTELTNTSKVDIMALDDELSNAHDPHGMNENTSLDGIELEHDDHALSYSFFGLLPLHRPLWWYFVLAFFDVEANAITMFAFRYTTLTGVTLFDALAIPSAMILSRYWLQRKYRLTHCLGAIVCMTGVVVNVLQDYKNDVQESDNEVEARGYPHKLWGDLCAISGGLLYGLNDVLTEMTVRHNDGTTEYLAMVGFFGFVISLIQSLLLEWDDISQFFDEGSATCSMRIRWLLLLSFVSVTIASYIGASRFLTISEAAFFNLSLLTGDLWSVVFSVVVERIVPSPLFFVALLLVLSGVILYEMPPSPVLQGGIDWSLSLPMDDPIEQKTGPLETSHGSHRLILSADDNGEDGAGIEMKEAAIVIE